MSQTTGERLRAACTRLFDMEKQLPGKLIHRVKGGYTLVATCATEASSVFIRRNNGSGGNFVVWPIWPEHQQYDSWTTSSDLAYVRSLDLRPSDKLFELLGKVCPIPSVWDNRMWGVIEKGKPVEIVFFNASYPAYTGDERPSTIVVTTKERAQRSLLRSLCLKSGWYDMEAFWKEVKGRRIVDLGLPLRRLPNTFYGNTKEDEACVQLGDTWLAYHTAWHRYGTISREVLENLTDLKSIL